MPLWQSSLSSFPTRRGTGRKSTVRNAWSYLGYAFLNIFLTYRWNIAAKFFLLPTQNDSSFTGGMIFLYPILLEPIFEEVIYRGLTMPVLDKGKVLGIGILVFSALFSVLYVVGYTWSWTDFIFYFVSGLL